MKLNEFKAWFEGFTEDMDRAPTAKQWKRIKERVAEIDGIAVSYPVYIDRYVRPYWSGPYYATTAGGIAACGSNNFAAYNAAISAKSFDAPTAMYAVGKAEASAS